MTEQIKKRAPKRDDSEYKEIENFKDYERINNAFYEMGIRNKKFRGLVKKYIYLETLSGKIDKSIEKSIEKLIERNQDKENKTENEITKHVIEQKSEQENFEEALKKIEDKNYFCQPKFNDVLTLDFEKFIEIYDFSLEKTDEELISENNDIFSLTFCIYDKIKKEFYIDIELFLSEETTFKEDGYVEYTEAFATSLYIKREYKESYYIETVIDNDNYNISRTIHPITKRKLLIDHIPKILSNHLMPYKESVRFFENLLKINEVKIKTSIALADAFFCYDYYHYRLEEVKNKNKKLKNQEDSNIFLKDARENIKLINSKKFLTNQEKKQDRLEFEKVIEDEKLNFEKEPRLNKKSDVYIFSESDFQKSDINSDTASKYYQWIKPYIDGKYIKIINKDILPSYS